MIHMTFGQICACGSKFAGNKKGMVIKMIKKMIKSGLAIVVAFSMIVMPGTFTKAEAAVNYDEVITLADQKADLLTSMYGVTSVQYALIDDGEIVVSGQSGVYSKDNTTALTNENMYGIGSISKTFTAVAVMQLVEQGKVKLDEPITTYIPKFKMADERYKDITVRMLLNHSSGLMGTVYGNASLFGDSDTSYCDDLLSALATQRLKADPGAFSVYCNDGFTLAQILVEKVSGISFSEYVDKNISQPLNLSHTKTPLDDFSRDQLAKTYYIDDNPLPIENVSVIGAGGIYSTAEDLCRFSEAFLGDGLSNVLSKTSATAMSNAEYLNGMWAPEADSLFSYGLGWDSVNTYPFNQYGIKAIVKGGDTGCYHGSLIALPGEGMAMAVLSSGGASTYNQVFAQEVLLKALLAKGTIKEIKADKTFTAPVKTTMPVEQMKYSGYYAIVGGVFKIDISKDGILSLYNDVASDISTQKFIYTGDGKFYDASGTTYLSFQKESNGNTYFFYSLYGSLPGIGQMADSGYQGQKIEANPISDKVKAVWEKRNNKKYFIVSEIYNSQTYAFSCPMLKNSMLTVLEGYFANATIIDKNTAQMQIQIPGLYGRDLSDLNFYTVGKSEYLESSGSTYISEDAIKALSTKATFNVKIGSKGDAQWYKISAKSKNKKVKVTLPKNASFSVYKADGTCTYNSVIAEKSTVTLPAGGYIVFVGDAKAKFTVKYVK